jgi:DNA repair exonuclease SbcCD ATPase subunit
MAAGRTVWTVSRVPRWIWPTWLQSGGSVGLLVLDEVFGPLDEERKARMLLALERLRSRFRQILVVTHAADIKEQLPYAIEVQKQPGRRATARLLN